MNNIHNILACQGKPVCLCFADLVSSDRNRFLSNGVIQANVPGLGHAYVFWTISNSIVHDNASTIPAIITDSYVPVVGNA